MCSYGRQVTHAGRHRGISGGGVRCLDAEPCGRFGKSGDARGGTIEGRSEAGSELGGQGEHKSDLRYRCSARGGKNQKFRSRKC